MFSKILIANRGEIALRVARSARRLGIATVAVYSDADRGALHVEACDEAVAIGGAEPGDSYLDGARILDVARACGAEAIHPGYGFLSENAGFARACAAAGIVFIGPPADAIEAMGSKSGAKALLDAIGVPLVPGYHGVDQAPETLARESRRIGYPQLIKASAGGGGKGMRRVNGAAEFADALAAARREALGAFGDDTVLIERYLERPRHIEIQVFADAHGHCIHLFERDCSIQRRHQKILEEAPAPGLDDGLRGRIGAAAIDCARAIDYRGAGTVEFLLDAQGRFYFMEMNTRLQVEHPVTEMITGQDLVEWQLRVAAGEPLPLRQEQVALHGHAIEARIYAESPSQDFMPAAGRIGYLRLPALSDRVRVDTGVRDGDDIGIHYDPMIAKLIVHGSDRRDALARMARALRQYCILGISTNIDFLDRLVCMPAFRDGDFDTGFIATHGETLFANVPGALEQALLLAACARLPAFAPAAAIDSPWDLRNHWRMNLPGEETIILLHDGKAHRMVARRRRGGWYLFTGEREYRVQAEWLDRHRMRAEIDGRRVEFALLQAAGRVQLACDGRYWCFELPRTRRADGADPGRAGQPCAPMSGAVVAVEVAAGAQVQAGDTLVVVEAMKMEHAIVAQAAASVDSVLVAVGDQVDEGQIVVMLEVE